MAEFFEFGAQFEVIVDFAIEDDAPFAGVFENGLIAALEVDDFQTRGAAGEGLGGEGALLVRSAMMQGGERLLNASVRGDSIFMRKTGNTAQAVPLFEKTKSAGLQSGAGNFPHFPR